MKILFNEDAGIARIQEPVSFGMPFPKGYLVQENDVYLQVESGADEGRMLPFGATVTARWHDDSIKWLLVDTRVSMGAGETLELAIKKRRPGDDQKEEDGWAEGETFIVTLHDGMAMIRSGPLAVDIGTQGEFHLFHRVVFRGKEIVSPGSGKVVLTGADGRVWQPHISQWKVEHDTRMKKTLCSKGYFIHDHQPHFIEFISRTYVFCRAPYVAFEFTLLNPRAARHQGGAWDLGDENSFLFKSMQVLLDIHALNTEQIFYSPEYNTLPVKSCRESSMRIHQNSSGHENWRSPNHMNRDEKIPLQYRGYRVYESGAEAGLGKHARPFMGAAGPKGCVYAYVENFWQNFPKTMAVSDDCLEIGLFPEEYGDLFELQPGEQKTHVFYVGFGQDSDDCAQLGFAIDPLVPEIACEQYFQSMTGPKPVPRDLQTKTSAADLYDDFIEEFITPETGYERKNIRIDEFGWRNFGDIYADHEAVFTPENQAFISHYNNQYDVIKGALFQFMRTGKKQWFTLARQLGDHVTDIDIYHTDQDKYQYNFGLFWHTDHHLDAHTATHRTISKAHRQFKPERTFGGGPYLEHNYATGLLYLYWVTGHPRYREGVVQLAGFVINWLEGPDTLSELGFQTLRNMVHKIRQRKGRGKPRIYVFDGPCRASGNSLNTLLDAYLLTHEKRYMEHAQALIARAVHPDDDLDEMDLLNAEIRWFYTVFLQALGRYLDIKLNENAVDEGFHYGRRVLVSYARWMLEHEYPYLEKPEILEFPNETWAAQDLRKSDVFAVASFYTGDIHHLFKEKCEEKSRFFFTHALNELSTFETRCFTRPMALLMSNGMSFLEMTYRNSNAGHCFSKIDPEENVPPPMPCHLPFYLQRSYKIRAGFSFKKELAWITRQVRSILGKQPYV